MSTISSVTTTSTTLPQSVGGTSGTTPAPATGTGQTAPAFQETLTTQGRVFALGLGAPRNHGDIEALFAEVAEKFGMETSKATNYAEAAEDAKRSTALRAAAGNLAFFASLSAMITAAMANIVKQTKIINEQTAVVNDLTAQKAVLEEEKSDLTSEWWDNAGDMAEKGIEVGALYVALGGALAWEGTTCGIDSGGAACADAKATVSDLQGQISTLESEISTLQNRNDTIDARIDVINDAIDVLDDGIDAANDLIDAAQDSLDESKAEVSFATALLTAFSLVLIPFTVNLALETILQIGRASFEMLPEQLGIDKAISDAVDNIANQAAEMQRQSLTHQEQTDDTDLDPTKPEGSPDTGRTPRVIDLLRQLMAQEVPPENLAGDVDSGKAAGVGQGGNSKGFELILAALEQALPPGEGDPKAVMDRAGDIAGSLALLRGVLGQFAGGESGMNTLVPGASGRLTLAI